ncbi:hypothetical protein ABMA75_10360 [Halobacteriovorax sp. ZH4_bin.1]|uniref:hypothetical protein n=1 Tax=unclassified Halobacteriovorax TaxID=2639665 RepID=UPI003723FB09
MKIILVMIYVFVISDAYSLDNIARGAGGGSGTLAPEVVMNNDELLGSGGGSGTLRESNVFEINKFEVSYDLLRISRTGEFDFDSDSDRWLLRTKSRVLSIKDIDLVEKYEVKQKEVDMKAFELNTKRKTVPLQFMKRYLEKNVKFNEYILDDFKY